MTRTKDQDQRLGFSNGEFESESSHRHVWRQREQRGRTGGEEQKRMSHVVEDSANIVLFVFFLFNGAELEL